MKIKKEELSRDDIICITFCPNRICNLCNIYEINIIIDKHLVTTNNVI